MSEGTTTLPIFLQENCRTIVEADGIQSESGAPEKRKDWHVAIFDTATRSVSVGRDKRLTQVMAEKHLQRCVITVIEKRTAGRHSAIGADSGSVGLAYNSAQVVK